MASIGDSDDALRELVASAAYRFEPLGVPGTVGIYPLRVSPARRETRWFSVR